MSDYKNKFDFVGNENEGLTVVGNKAVNGKMLFGFVNENGARITSLKYSLVWNFQNGLAMVKIEKSFKGDKQEFWGVINKSGEIIIPCEYELIFPYNKVSFLVKQNKKWGVFDIENLRILIQIKYDWIFPVKEKKAVFRLDKKYGAIDANGKEIIPPVYDELKGFSQGLCAARKKDKWGFIDEKNNAASPFI